jgi:MFS family permease
LLILFGSSALVYSGLYFIDIGTLTYVAIFLAGLSISALLPLMLTQASLLYHEIAGTVMGSIKVAIPLGGILIPFLMSVLVNYAGFELSLIVFPLSLLLAFFLIYLTSPLKTRVKQSQTVE